MGRFLVVALIVFTAFPALADVVNYKSYTNKAYGFSFKYPDYMVQIGDTDPNEGQKFKAIDGSQLAVYASANPSQDSMQDIYNEELNAVNLVVAFQNFKPNSFVISGIQNDNVFYEKVLRKDNTTVYVVYTYPKQMSEDYKEIPARIGKSLSISTKYLPKDDVRLIIGNVPTSN